MKLEDVLNPRWIDAKTLNSSYAAGDPFPHIVMEDFLNVEYLKAVADEFPDLKSCKTGTIKFSNNTQIKFASKGMQLLTPSALQLNSYLQSDAMLQWLNQITGIEETLISDPYLAGGGYHEIKRGGMLKIHADFAKHPLMDLDRRCNLIIYLNEDWEDDWGGGLELFGDDMSAPVQKVHPRFNTAVLFTTTAHTLHGHPDPLECPDDRSRRSLAYYYFSSGRPEGEAASDVHATNFKPRKDEKFAITVKSVLKEVTPPFLMKSVRNYIDNRR